MISHYEKNAYGRDFVVGDIHGGFSRLMAALENIQFDFNIDRLFSVGDLVDRGPENEEVLNWIGKPWFFPVRGNHDDFAIRYAKIGELDFAHYSRNGGAWFISLPKDEQMRIADALETMPHAISVETDAGLVGIVHADIPTGTWAELKAILESDLSRNKMRPYTDYLMWSRDRSDAGNEYTIPDLHKLIVGHTPSREPRQLGNVIFIDTMGWRENGKFTLVQIN